MPFAPTSSRVRPLRGGALAGTLLLSLAACSGDGASWFNFSDGQPVAAGPVRESGTAIWLQDGVNQQQRDRDIRQCRQVATAQVARDQRIDEDRQVGQATLGNGDRSRQLMTTMDDYSRDQRQARLFASCMRSRGYERR